MLSFDRILETIEVGVVVHDADTRIIYGNRMAQRVLGVAESEMRQRTTFDARWALIGTDGAPIDPGEIPVVKAIRTGTAVRGSVVGVLAGGGSRAWLLVDATPVAFVGSKVQRVVVSFTDITRETMARLGLEQAQAALGEAVRRSDEELVETRRALRLSEAEYRSVLRSMSEGVVAHAPDGTILFANPAAEHILGLTVEQMQGRHPVDPSWRLTDVHGAALPASAIPSEITRRTGEPCRNVVLGVHRGASERAWLSVSTDPVATGEAASAAESMVVATFTDVTVERHALEDARRSRDHLRDLAAALPGVVIEYLVRHDGTDAFLYVSEPAREYFGVEPADALRDPAAVWERVHPDDSALVRGLLRDAVAARASTQFELRVMNRQGQYRYARLRSSVPSAVSEGLLFRSVVLDVTEQKLLEESMRAAQRREAMGTLAAGIAHNFNNLLASIIPNLELALEGGPSAFTEELSDAHRSATAAADLVRQLMQLVRREVGERPVPVDLGQLGTDVVRICRQTFDKAIDIVWHSPLEECVVLGRRAELQQVVLNLCINARDAVAGVAGPRLVVGVRADGDMVQIVVQDNGIGMDADAQAKLGQPFFTTKAPGQGTGLGLATVFGIVRDAGGTLDFASEVGSGTRFLVRLPRHGGSPRLGAALSPTPAREFALRFLIVDDEALVRSALLRMLKSLGCVVEAVSSGEEALGRIAAGPSFDAILVDLTMPGMSGNELVRRLNRDGVVAQLFVVSGFVADDSLRREVAGIVPKPVDVSHLREICLFVERTKRSQ